VGGVGFEKWLYGWFFLGLEKKDKEHGWLFSV
jgi:hypothetical protein